MKVQKSDIKNLSQVGSDPSRFITDDQIYVTGDSINKTLKQAVIDGNFGGAAPNAAIITPTSNTFNISTSNDNVILHNLPYAGLYLLPSITAGTPLRYTFVHQGVNPTEATQVLIDSTNNKVYFSSGVTDYEATIASSTYASYSALATAIQTAMNAAFSNSFVVSFVKLNPNSMTAENQNYAFKITGSAAFSMDFASFTTNSAAAAMGFHALDTGDATTHYGHPYHNELRIRAASGDRIRFANNLAENPGYIALGKRGVSVTLTSIDGETWIVSKIAHRKHEKNSDSIGSEKDISIVGRNSWTSRTNMNSLHGRHGATALNGYGYAMGGKDVAANAPIAVVQQYNDSANTWATKASDLTSRRGQAAFSINGYAYNCYGDSSNLGTDIDTTNRYNDSANSWLSRAGGASARRFISRFALNGYGYIAGGTQVSTAQTTVQRYNDNLNSWSTMAALISLRSNQFGDMLNGYGYAFCGFDGSFQSVIHTQYNDSANAWIQKTNALNARTDGVTFSLNGKLNKCQGYDGSSRTSNCEEYNDSTNTWRTIASAANNRAEIKGFVISGFGYSCGGFDGTYQQTTEQYN